MICWKKFAFAPRATSACWSPRSPSAWPKICPNISRKSACVPATCTPKSKRWTASRSCAICAAANSTSSSASTCCAKGLDLPEVSLVAILDADKEGYLRSATSLIQTIGRCARHISGRAILYADRRTGSMEQAISETYRRRDKQLAYNKENNITPESIVKSVDMELARIVEADYVTVPVDDVALDAATANVKNEAQLAQLLQQLESQMREAAKKFEFEKAAQLRDRIRTLKQRDLAGLFSSSPAPTSLQDPDAAGA